MPVSGLAFGANLGDPAAQIAEAARLIEARGIARLIAASSLWRTPPWGLEDQPAFINACALVETGLSPRALLRALKEIERDMGREPGLRWGPRPIDIDIVFHGDCTLDSPDLVLPHPQTFERAFVLAPLAEIAPDLALDGRPIRDALARLDQTGLEIAGGRDWAQECGIAPHGPPSCFETQASPAPQHGGGSAASTGQAAPKMENR